MRVSKLILIVFCLFLGMGVYVGVEKAFFSKKGGSPQQTGNKLVSPVDKQRIYGLDVLPKEEKTIDFSKENNSEDESIIKGEQDIIFNNSTPSVKNIKPRYDTLPKDSIVDESFFNIAANFLIKKYDFKEKRFKFSLKQLNLYFGIDLKGFKTDSKDILQSRRRVLKYVLDSYFLKYITPIINNLFFKNIELKLDSLVKNKNISNYDKKIFYKNLSNLFLSYSEVINLFLNSYESYMKDIRNYFLIQRRLIKVYQQYWQLEEKDVSQKERLGNLIKKNIFAREYLKRKILARLQLKQITREDKLYLCFWLYRRLDQDKFSFTEIKNLAELLKETGKFLQKQIKSDF